MGTRSFLIRMIELQTLLRNGSFIGTPDDDLTVGQHSLKGGATAIVSLTNHYGLAYCMKGGVRWSKTQASWHIGERELLFANKGAYRLKSDLGADTQILLVLFSDRFLRDAASRVVALQDQTLWRTSSPVLPLDVDEFVTTGCHVLSRLLSLPHAVPHQLAGIKINDLLFHLFLGGHNESLRALLAAACAQTRPDIVMVMENNYLCNLPLSQYAMMCGRSLSAFKEDFRQLYATTPARWLVHKRLHYARTLLDKSNFSIAETAETAGFVNVAHFIKVFKARYHVTPLALRKRQLSRNLSGNGHTPAPDEPGRHLWL
ncbi:MAG: helix-turn-helix transcriptional regulator [Bacteroidia bacterium]|nr:helix-turn-helix transcriptional regulator [Bacteroidia bacterium]